MDNKSCEWIDIPGYQMYKINIMGEILSERPKNGIVSNIKTTPRILKKIRHHSGYEMVSISKNMGEKRRNIYVHKLMAVSFLDYTNDNRDSRMVIDHINNIKHDNRLSNLQIISSRQNVSKSSVNNTTNTVGVSFHSRDNKFASSIQYKNRVIHLGYFDNIIDAKCEYDTALMMINSGSDINKIYTKRINSSKYKYITYNKSKNKWVIQIKGKYFGAYDTENNAYDYYLKNLI